MNASAIYDVAELVRSCVCDAMDAAADEAYTGCPCLSYVSAGEPQVECCTTDCGGMLTVHVESVYPSDNFPQPFSGFEPCKAATWVAVVVVTAARCSPATDEQGNLPPMEDLDAVAQVLSIDQYAILQALSCCVPAQALPGKRTRRVQIDTDAPQTSEGGCATVEVRAFVDAGRMCGCPSES